MILWLGVIFLSFTFQFFSSLNCVGCCCLSSLLLRPRLSLLFQSLQGIHRKKNVLPPSTPLPRSPILPLSLTLLFSCGDFFVSLVYFLIYFCVLSFPPHFFFSFYCLDPFMLFRVAFLLSRVYVLFCGGRDCCYSCFLMVLAAGSGGCFTLDFASSLPFFSSSFLLSFHLSALPIIIFSSFLDEQVLSCAECFPLSNFPPPLSFLRLLLLSCCCCCC